MNYDSRDVIKQIRKGLLIRTSLFGEQTWQETCLFLLKEFGRMVDSLLYIRFGDKPEIAGDAYAKSEVMDMLTQIDIMCQIRGWDFDDLRREGAEKFLTRMMEYKEKV